MASFREDATEMNTLDDDVSAIIGEYSIPNLAEITSESLLTRSQYAKVIFHDLLPCYPTDANIWCRYSLTDDIKSRHGDRVALYRVGWVSVHDHVQFEMAPVTNNVEEREFRVLFKAEVLPKDTTEFYQLCYVNVDDAVCGASVPFQFRHPMEEELCEVEEQGGLMVVRSTTAISEEKLRDAARLIDELESEKLAHEEKIQALESTKDSLSMKVEELSSIQQRETQLRHDIRALEDDKTQAFENLNQANKRIQALCAKVESLNRDNCALNDLLKGESHKVMTEELSRYRNQVDNMQQMLDALAESKELASQALQCEQSKVMTLNIEHDKYKFRSQQMEEENKGLRLDLQQKKQVIDTLELRLKQNEVLLESKFKENEATLSKLQQVIKQIGQLQFELNQVNEKNECLQLHLKQRENQILMLDMEMRDLRQKGGSFDQLNEEYANLKRKLKEYDGVWTKVKSLKEDNASLRKEAQRLQEEVSELLQYKVERDRLSSEFELLSASHMALQNELYTSSMNNTSMQELQNENVSHQSHIQNTCDRETPSSQSVLSIEELKNLLSAAEASNASLMNELTQIKKLQPDWVVSNEKNGNLQHAVATKSSGECIRCTTTFRAPARSTELQQMFKTLKDEREKVEAELQEVTTKENDFLERCVSKSKRLTAIEEDVVNAKNELELAVTKNRQAKEDLMVLNNRMVSIQQQILQDDQREGRDFYESGDQERLERMSKRCHDLQCLFSGSTSEIHDLKQNIQVLEQERVHIEEELKEKPLLEMTLAREKCQIFEKLVFLDQKLILLREGEMFPMRKESVVTCPDLSAEHLGNSQSCEIRSTNLDPYEDAIIPQVIDSVSITDIGAEGISSYLIVPTSQESKAPGIGKLAVSEPIEIAVESGVCEGIVHGINTLKRQVSEQLTPNSVNSSMESITSIEQKCARANEECQEQERALQENLAAALKNTVRKELLGSIHDLNLQDVVETSSETKIERSDVEADLKLRLDMAAEEYKKLYMQKLKLEKQLLKMQQKQTASSSQSSSVISTEETSGFVCPICGVCFPPANRDSFTRHYEDHLF